MTARCSDLSSWSFSGVPLSSDAVADPPPSWTSAQSVVTGTIVPLRPWPEESTATSPLASSNRYQATFPPPAVPPAEVVNDWISAAPSARS